MTMKPKMIRHGIQAKLFAAVLLASGGFAASANAQTVAAKFTLPFETHWGKNVLPAGEYTITMDSLADVALVRSAKGKTIGFTPIPIRAKSHEGGTALLLMVRGDERRTRFLN